MENHSVDVGEPLYKKRKHENGDSEVSIVDCFYWCFFLLRSILIMYIFLGQNTGK